MKDIMDVNVIVDDKYEDTFVNIYTKKHTEQIDNIIYSIENAAKNKYPPIPVYDNDNLKFISQREVYRIKIEGRNVILETEKESYTVKGTMARFEEELDSERFFRISQSEIVNLYKVDSFDFSIKGNIGVVFDNGTRSFVARRCVKSLRDKLKNGI
ncbi:MAG: LytTR family transcriptional regulator [Lachnospiraceae bacterium]|nr:LytTR family transcriptional regulator [Lachnospiraceae bacterium]